MMKRTTSSLLTALAPVALIPLAVACSKRPAQSPTGTSAQQGEPGVSSGQMSGGGAQGQQPTGQLGPSQAGQENAPDQVGQYGQQGQSGGYAQQGQYGQQGQQGQYGQQGQQGQYGRPGQPGFGAGLGQQGEQGEATGGDKAACDALTHSSKLKVEDVQGGVAIVATPKSGQNINATRDDARRLEQAIRAGSRAGESCGIADLARLPSVSTQVIERESEIRITMTTSNTGEVKDLRRIARDEVNTMSKGGGKQQQPQQHPQRQP